MMQVFDRAHFDHMTGADEALQKEVVGLFRGQSAQWRAMLAGARGWREGVHTLKGSARGIGLHALALACEAAEAAPDGEAAPALARVGEALEEALAALGAY